MEEESGRKPKLRLYRLLKPEFGLEDYLLEIPEYKLRRELARLRSGSSDLALETGRWRDEDVQDRICCVCGKDGVEDEAHCLLICYPLEDLRRKMWQEIGSRLTYDENDQQYMIQCLLGCGIREKQSSRIVRIAVAKFLFRVMKRRKRWFS